MLSVLRVEKTYLVLYAQFFLSVILEQSKRAVLLLTHEETAKLLSPRRAAIWEHLEKVREATPMEISRATSTPRPTINQVLTKLLRLKRIERIGSGSATRYRVIGE